MEALWREEELRKIEAATANDFAPWEIGYVGAKTEGGVCNVQDLRLTPTTRSSSNSLAGVHELEISASGRLSVYELQPTDVGQYVLQQTSQTGVLVSPDVALEDVGEQFIAVHTKGDGGCALHAVWGGRGEWYRWSGVSPWATGRQKRMLCHAL